MRLSHRLKAFIKTSGKSVALAGAFIAAGVTLLHSDPASAAKGIADYQDTWGENFEAFVNVIGWAATAGGAFFIVKHLISLIGKAKQMGQPGAQQQGVGGDIAGIIVACLLVGFPIFLGVGPASLWGDDAQVTQIGDKDFAKSIGKK